MKRIYVGTSKINGKGIFADEAVTRGEKIQYINGTKVRMVPKSKHDSDVIGNWIGMSESTWINTEGTPFRYINHSCNPNAAIVGKKTLIAIKSIAAAEEISIDYSMTDADPHWSIPCSCGERNCRKVIRSIYSIPDEVFMRHMPFVTKFFQKAYARSHVQEKKSK